MSASQSIVKFINEVPYMGVPAGVEVGVGSKYSISILLRDAFSNFLWTSPATPNIFLDTGYNCGSVDQCFPVVEIESQKATVGFDFFRLYDYKDATYLLSFSIPKSGRFPINLKVGVEQLGGSPFFLYVFAGEVSLSSTSVSGLGISSCGAGLSCTFSVSASCCLVHVYSPSPRHLFTGYYQRFVREFA
jgi:hypothetical protein